MRDMARDPSPPPDPRPETPLIDRALNSGNPAVRRSVLISVAVGTPLSALLLWLSIRGADLGTVADALNQTSALWVLGVLASFTGTYLCFALRWNRLVHSLGVVSFGRVLALVLAGAALSNTIPGRPGELARGYSIAHATQRSVASGIGSVAIDRAFDVLVLAATLVIVLPFAPHPPWVNDLVIAATAIGVVFALLLVAAWWRVHGGGARKRPAVRGLRSRPREAASAFVDGLAAVRSGSDLVFLTGLSAAAWFFWGLGAWFCAKGLDISLDLKELAFLTAVVNLGVAIPSSPGFIGTYQWLVVTGLGVFSAAGRSHAFAFAVLLHALSLIPTTIVGYGVIVGLATGRRRRLLAADLEPREQDLPRP